MGRGAGTRKSGWPCTPSRSLVAKALLCSEVALPFLVGRWSVGSSPMLASLIACSSEMTFASQWHEHEHQASLMIHDGHEAELQASWGPGRPASPL